MRPSDRPLPEVAPRADALVVLGCRVMPSGALPSPAAGRAAAAAAAFRAGVAPLIVASGGRRWGTHIEAVALKSALLRHGVPASAIVTELWSLTTLENALFSAAVLRRLGAQSAVIVTCSWHVPRALHSFRAAGLATSAWPRAAVPGLVNRWAEPFRAVYDARLFRHTQGLAAAAHAFLPSKSPRNGVPSF